MNYELLYKDLKEEVTSGVLDKFDTRYFKAFIKEKEGAQK